MIEDLKLIARKVRETERALPHDYDRGLVLRQGADGTPTLNIDQVAEDAIVDFVKQRKLPYNILSEEAGFIDRKQKRTLVIDPIDGTQNSVAGVPFYSVSLAVGTKSMEDTQAGVVMNLVTGDTYHAEKGKGAFKNDQPIRVRPYHQYSSLILVYIGKYASIDDFNVARDAVRSRAFGCASLEMCLVAEGKADGYYMNCEVRERSVRVIDIAASALILREAGGDVVDLAGKRLDMRFDLEDRQNILAYGDEKLKEAVL
ncbi:MAG TPA: inositol monophosphatase family protein [Methanomassiliicoccales archaeon]|nr:inositol monophosphatase family protein [Methanomassiliicoccales archaeon]